MKNIEKERLIVAGFCSFILALGSVTSVGGSQGSIQLSVQGYGSVHGQLENATIQPNGNVSLLMLVNDRLVTSQGTFPTSARGVWLGTLNGSSLIGQIQDVSGVVQICLVICQDANFIGSGQWRGLLNGSDAAGDFSGSITFTNSPVPQIPTGQPIPVSGTWTTTFQLPMPEIREGVWSYTLIGALITAGLASAKYQVNVKRRPSRRPHRDQYAFLRKLLRCNLPGIASGI